MVAQKYRVDRLLGQGGMAAVWEGTNERTGKRVALKVILQSLASHHEAEHLFHFEALATSRINHPNVVTVFDVIEHQTMACIVMELLEGESFGTFIARKGPLSVEEALALLLPAMRGVAAAHAEGIVHRDIKPANIFLCMGPDRRVLTTKVLDFGVALMAEHMRDGAQTRDELTAGTPVYMSPEHLSGERVDGRTDVYSFGILLYEALTGDGPFVGEIGSPLFERIIHEPPPPVTIKRPDLPPGVVHVIHKALAKDPEERFRTLDLMVDALEDELMRRPGLPRSLTPLTGIAMIDSGRVSGGSSPAIKLPASPESSSGPHETRMLFGLSLAAAESGPVPAPSAASAPLKEGPSTVVIVPPLRRVVPALKRVVASSRSRMAISAGVVLVLGVSLWLALGTGPKPKAPLPSPPTVAPKPIVIPTPPAAVPPPSETPVEPSPNPVGAATPATEERSAADTAARAVRAPKGVDPASHGHQETWDPFNETPASPSAAKPSTKSPEKAAPSRAVAPASGDKTPSAKAAAPRAGRLSADDF
jgi:serine/threonine-protein kinase